MFCMPIYAVPKPHSLDFRLVNDHSASKHSLNSMIDHDSVTGFPLDSLAQYGHILAALHARNVDLAGACPITAWKSDIAEAYQLCPMHPAWQNKTGCMHQRRDLRSASGSIFIAFNSLVTWIARHERCIDFVTTYVDDSSGCALSDDVAYYAPYQRTLPAPQAKLLELWDELGIPHAKRKQLSGPTLPIIGIQVDPNAMTYSLPPESKIKLISELEDWESPKGLRHTVRRW